MSKKSNKIQNTTNEENKEMNETTNEIQMNETEVTETKEKKVRKVNNIFATVHPMMKGVNKAATAYVKMVLEKKNHKEDIKKLEVILDNVKEEINNLMNAATLESQFRCLSKEQKELLKQMLNEENNNEEATEENN